MPALPTPQPATRVSPGAPAWRLRLLGTFQLADDRHVLHLRSRAACLLLARVALAPERDHPREELATLLWPQADAAAGRNRLRQTLALLKAALEPAGAPALLLADRRVLRLARGAMACDAVAFEQAVRAGPRDVAHRAYRGELLPGFDDEWVVDERERLAALHRSLVDAPVAPAPGAPDPSASDGVAGLPHYLTRLIGADVVGARLHALVAERRLVTILGAGGVGKTRLAVEVARWLCESGSGAEPARFERALYVGLVGVADADGLLDRLLQALRIEPLDRARAPLAVLSTLRGRVLVLLDNCEQLDDGATALIARLAEQLPAAQWLLTSRRPLGLDGEATFVVDGLPLPAPGAAPQQLALNAAVALYVDRARSRRADFRVQAANADALVELLHRLEGLPLAIELAALHARTLGPAELLDLLRGARDDAAGLAFLARRGARSGSDPRQASMLAVIEWSWRLLDANQRRLLGALCRRPDGATLDEAAALGDGLPRSAPLLQARLDELVAQAVIRITADVDGRRRYRPYGAMREYVLAGAPAV